MITVSFEEKARRGGTNLYMKKMRFFANVFSKK